MVQLSRLIVVLLVVLLAVPSVALADNPSQAADPEAIAQALVDNLLAEDYAAATENFNAKMLDALPAEKLQQVWESLPGQLGAYQSKIDDITTQEADGATTVFIPLQFEQAAIVVKVAVDADGQVAGLFFAPYAAPAANQPAYEPPAYVDTGAFTEQDMTVTSGDWSLPGTLTMPVGDGPFPAVVLVQGSGPHDRDETIGPNRPFRDLAWGLASQGIAVLRYDKRTYVYGASSANPPESLTIQQETVDDAVSATALLQQTDGINPDQVFVLGHSLGGYVAPRIAAGASNLAGVIVMAGNTRPLEDLYIDQVSYLLTLDGDLSSDDQAQIDAVAQAVQQVKDLAASDNPTGVILNIPVAYWLDLKNYDPVQVAAGLGMPMLFLQGERDYQVTLTDFDLWRQGLAMRDNVTFISYPDLNHLFMSGEGLPGPDEYDMPGHISELVINNIAGWITSH